MRTYYKVGYLTLYVHMWERVEFLTHSYTGLFCRNSSRQLLMILRHNTWPAPYREQISHSYDAPRANRNSWIVYVCIDLNMAKFAQIWCERVCVKFKWPLKFQQITESFNWNLLAKNDVQKHSLSFPPMAKYRSMYINLPERLCSKHWTKI